MTLFTSIMMNIYIPIQLSFIIIQTISYTLIQTLRWCLFFLLFTENHLVLEFRLFVFLLFHDLL